MFDKHHKKENPTFTGITRGVGGFGFGVAAGAVGAGPQVSDNYWFAMLGQFSYATEGYGVAVDSAGNIYVTGKTKVPSGYGGSDRNKVITAKYDTNGVIQWQRTLSSGDGSGNEDEGRDIIIDNSGNIIVVGRYQSQYGLIAKYSPSGDLEWSKFWGANTYHYKVDFDNDGNIYTANEGAGAMRISKFNSSGDHQWSQSLDTSNGGSTEAYNLTVDRNNNRVYLIGKARAFAGNTSGSNYEGVLARYSTSGVLSWVRAWDTNPLSDEYDVWGTTVAVDNSGTVFANGWAEIGGYGSNYRDIFYARFTSSGSFSADARFSMGTNIDEYPEHALCDSSGKLYVVGRKGSFGPGLLLKYQANSTIKEYARQLGPNSQVILYGVALDSENKAVYLAGYTNRSGAGNEGSGSSNYTRNFLIAKVPIDGSMTDSSYDFGDLSYTSASTSGSQSYSATYQNVKSPSGTMSSISASRSEFSTTPTVGIGTHTPIKVSMA